MSGVPILVPPRSLLLYTDTSLSGWRAHLLDLTALGVWLKEESLMQINVLEMKAVSSSGCFSALAVGSQCRPDEHQHLGCRLSSASRRHSVACSVRIVAEIALWTERHSVSVGQVHSGEEERSGGPAQLS